MNLLELHENAEWRFFVNKEVSVLLHLLNDLMINHFKVPLGVLAQLKGRYASSPISILNLELFMNGVEMRQKVCIFPNSITNSVNTVNLEVFW